MDYNYTFFNEYSDSYFTLTSLGSNIPARHFKTLTNQVCRIVIIQINIYPSPNIMNKTEIIIIFSLHRVSGDTTRLSHMVNHLTNSQLHILLIKINQIQDPKT